ncbi:hypothetical protein [Agrobacterium vitis]|uniref:Uncharacterized protein n=1 Tax=Agrobacterium vitis TaxID=373 RepID=A0A7K1RI18_AGRVI|nr:hypothetical protein [Agrobacterium vitis]MVA57569.1 hypothetical protein [Agrobacterium vitis]
MSFPEEKIWDHINDGWSQMSFRQRKLWEMIKRLPEEWEVPGYGLCWVVALMGNEVIFYDHFEEGFARSSWSQYGVVDQYQSGGDLGFAVQTLLNNIAD